MESFVRGRSYIHGSHTLKNHPTCGRDCGHFWEFTVLVAGEELEARFGMAVDEVKLQNDLDDIRIELSGKNIDKMLKPSVSSPVGIAYWLQGRLASKYDVREVEVWRDQSVSALLKAP